jgi:hypothetical protein
MRPGSGGGGNHTAAHHAAHFMRQQSHLVSQQNMRWMMNRRWVVDLIHEVVSTPATIEELQSLAVVFKEAQFKSFDSEQFTASISESPYAWLIRMLPENKDQAYAFIGILIGILNIVLSFLLHGNPQAPVGVTPDQEKQIIEQLEDHIDEDLPYDCPSEIPILPHYKLKQPE